jgi:hypothetical protein
MNAAAVCFHDGKLNATTLAQEFRESRWVDAVYDANCFH